jgi:sugar/nucleoside kinase (ribokinase family)
MSRKNYGLTVIGNAIVDILSRTDDVFIAAQGMKKGGMALIDKARARVLAGATEQAQAIPGGSGANSLFGYTSFGATDGAFIGKTGGDEFGRKFRRDLKLKGIRNVVPLHRGEEETGQSYIFISPDGERTMNTYLGANLAIAESDIQPGIIARSRMIFVEAYALDNLGPRAAFNKAVQVAKETNTSVALTLSDSKCVERHREILVEHIQNDHVGVIFGNEREIKALTGMNDFNAAAKLIAENVMVAALTRGAKGASISDCGEMFDIAPVKPEKFVDSTGAGDAFGSGILYGLLHGLHPKQYGLMGAKAASATIAHVGARSAAVKFSDFLPR